MIYFGTADPEGMKVNMENVVYWIKCSIQKVPLSVSLLVEQSHNSLDKRLTDKQWKLFQEFQEDKRKGNYGVVVYLHVYSISGY